MLEVEDDHLGPGHGPRVKDSIGKIAILVLLFVFDKFVQS
jgi:hypothetical protein